VRIRGSTVDRAVHEVGILRFEIARVLDERTDDDRPEPGRHLFEVIPDPPVRRVWAGTLDAGSRSVAASAMVAVLAEVGAGLAAEAVPAAAV